MKSIKASSITQAVSRLCGKANIILRNDVARMLKSTCACETSPGPRRILQAVVDNARIARQKKLAICQDTGMPCVFLEVGQDVHIIGDLHQAVLKGIGSGYKKACLRKSIVRDPLARGKCGYIPAIIHTDIVAGNRLKITVMPKGFGCENKSRLKMFNPTASWDKIKEFIVESVKQAGPDACPPYVVGVGIGGNAEYACLLAKKALLRNISSTPSNLERDILKQINKLGIGPMGLGGKATALAVRMETYPTHIAGLPVAVNISCHALRSAKITL